MRVLSCAVAGSLSLAAFTAAQAEDKASLTLNLPALTYKSASAKTKPDGGTEATAKTNQTLSQDLSGAYAQFTLGNFNLYYNPFVDGHLVSPSYMITPMVEVGLDIGLNSTKVDKPDTTSSNSTFGLFAWLYPSLGAVNSELGLGFQSIAVKSEEPDTAGVVQKGESTESVVKVTANVLVPIAKNLTYVGGLWYEHHADDEKKPAKVKTTTGIFGVNLATLRLTVD